MLYFLRVIFPFCTLAWRANTYVFRRVKGIKSRNESTKTVVIDIANDKGMTTTAIVILILNQATLGIRFHETLAQKMATTVTNYILHNFNQTDWKWECSHRLKLMLDFKIL